MPMELSLRDERPVALKCEHAWHEACLVAHIEELGDICPTCGASILVDETKSKDTAAIGKGKCTPYSHLYQRLYLYLYF